MHRQKFSKKIKNNCKKTCKKTCKSQKTRKNILRKKGGSGSENVTCCMCNNTVAINKSFTPAICLRKHGAKAHRICGKCWWDPIDGFAREGVNHECPGCKKRLPLLKPKNDSKVTEIVDLTQDA